MSDVIAQWNLHGHRHQDSKPTVTAVSEVPALIPRLCRGTDAERIGAAEALGRAEAPSQGCLSAILKVLADDQLPAVRWRAVEALRRWGPTRQAAPGLVLALLTDPSRSVRWRAAEALAEIGSMSSGIIDALVQATGDDDRWVQWHAKRVIDDGVPADHLVPALAEVLSTSASSAVKLYALDTLARKGTRHALSVAAFSKALSDPDPLVRARAVEGLPAVSTDLDWAERLVITAFRDPDPRVRSGAASALVGARTPSTTGTAALLTALPDEERPSVQTSLAAALGRSRTRTATVLNALAGVLDDEEREVRHAAALSMVALGEVTDRLTSVVDDLGDQLTPEAWQILVQAISENPGCAGSLLGNLSPTALERLLPEEIARGVLPTIGLRIWEAGADIRFPAKEGGDAPEPLAHPWTNEGVFHSWECLRSAIAHRTSGPIQACFHGQWFEGIHLIAIAHMILTPPPPRTATRPPARIEGRAAGFIVEGGGKLIEVDGRRVFSTSRAPNRIDFLFAHDLRMLQYLFYAGLVANGCSARRVRPDSDAAAEWTALVPVMIRLLARYGLDELSREPWFSPEGWRSSRYGLRHERRYADIEPGIAALFAVLASAAGPELRGAVRHLVDPLLERLDASMWISGLATYPPEILTAIKRRSADARVRWYAASALQAQTLPRHGP